MKEFGYSARTTTYDTIAYLKAADEWEKDLSAAIKRSIAAEENLKNVRSRKPYPGKFKSTPIKWNKEGYEKAIEKFKAEMNSSQKGVQRTRPIHESWNKVLELFDSTNPQRSQGAFCRWSGVKPATFSNWKNKPLTDDVERWILEWHWIGDGEGLDGSMNTNQDQVEDTPSPMERGRIIYNQYRQSGYAVPGLKKKLKNG